MEVAVIIPVYNAEKFIEQAVHSALIQKEVVQVILVEDGSSDDSLKVCRTLQKSSPKVDLLQHPDGQNHGAGASRNLGLLRAQAPFISFLDADDYYLENRFATNQKIFAEFPDADGLYGAARVHFSSLAARKQFAEYGGEPLLITMKPGIPPADLFYRLLQGRSGFFHLSSLILKRDSLSKKKISFDESMEIAQDVDFMFQLAARCTLYHSQMETPAIIRRIHENNRIFDRSKELFYRTYLYDQWFQKVLKENFPSRVSRLLLRYHLDHLPSVTKVRHSTLGRLRAKFSALSGLIAGNPELIMKLTGISR